MKAFLAASTSRHNVAVGIHFQATTHSVVVRNALSTTLTFCHCWNSLLTTLTQCNCQNAFHQQIHTVQMSIFTSITPT
uniref:Uncharacterized protein n=1 Tax=Arion vulgaris TaxID=1028688 RepID=A0A0B7AXY4_9EUPU